MTEDEMDQWHHRLDGHELEQVLGVGEGQGGLACCSPWGHKQLDTTERLKNNSNSIVQEAVTNVIPKEKKCKKVSGCLRRFYKEPRREEKGKGEKER